MGDLSVLPQFVQCPAGDWTPLCELRPGRKSLAIQCPQYGVAVASVEALIINDDIVRQVVAANPLRSRLVTSVGRSWGYDEFAPVVSDLRRQRRHLSVSGHYLSDYL